MNHLLIFRSMLVFFICDDVQSMSVSRVAMYDELITVDLQHQGFFYQVTLESDENASCFSRTF